MNTTPENQILMKLIQSCLNLSLNGFKLITSGTDITKMLLRSLVLPLEYELENVALLLRPPSAPAVMSPPRGHSSQAQAVRWSPQTPPRAPLLVSTPVSHKRYARGPRNASQMSTGSYRQDSSASSYYDDESSDYLMDGSKYYDQEQAMQQFNRRYGRHETVQDLPMNRQMGKPFDRNAYTMVQTATTVTPKGERKRLTRTTSGPDLSVLTATNTDLTDEMSTSGVETSFYSDAEEHLTP